jgi:RNA polymerase sigma-70 factor (family 1)
MSFRNLYDVNIRECFQALAKGDSGVFEILFESYKKRVFGVALKILKSQADAEEIVQNVFLSIWQSRARLDNINDPEAYLFTITYNAIHSHFKKASRNEQLLNAILWHIAKKQSTTEEAVAARETSKMIQKAIRQLPPQQRAIFELNRDQGLSYHEIAEHMHISQNTVRNHLSVALKTIQTVLEKWALPFVLGMGIVYK